jgi:acetyl esterase/lipase
MKRPVTKLKSTAALCLLSSISQAETVTLWTDTMPGTVTDQPEQIEYQREKDNRHITHTSQPTLKLYLLKNKTPQPFVIVCPGGGYRFLSIDKEGVEIAEWLNKIGLSAGVLTYRTPNNREGALHDANQAILLSRQYAKKWNIDPAKIGMIGFSAGAHLTAAAAQHPPQQDFSILVYPAYLNQDESTQLTEDISVSTKTPPTFITQALDDTRYYRSALAYSLALEQQNVPFELHFYTQGGHGYGKRDLGKPAHKWTTPCKAWLQNQQIIPAE